MASTGTPKETTRLKAELWLFLAALAAYGWFHQGGGWNQNARFALVRAVGEQGRLAVDDRLVYAEDDAGGRALRNVPVRDARLTLHGIPLTLAWADGSGTLHPLGGEDAAGGQLVAVEDVAATGDLAFHDGHFYPNKAPGVSLAAVPGYAAVRAIGRLAGAQTDAVSLLTLDMWLATLLSVGWISALGVVLFWRAARALTGGVEPACLLATLAFAFGTMFFPYATMLYEHNVAACALLGSFVALYGAGWQSLRRLVVGGALAGAGVAVSYLSAPALLALFAYVCFKARALRSWAAFAAGAVVPLALLAAYHTACFGRPWATAYAHQNPLFQDAPGGLLEVFTSPQPTVLAALLFSPFRGLFWTSPVLLLGVVGLGTMFREPRVRPEAWLFTGLIAFPLLVNASFEAWHGGGANVPRYLATAVPFLALPIAFAARRFLRTTCALAALSTAAMLLTTAVDPQSLVGVLDATRIGDLATWRHDPLRHYTLPLFLHGQARPVLEARIEVALERYANQLARDGVPEAERRVKVETARASVKDAVGRGDPRPIQLASIRGPVSVNPIGLYESGMYQLFPAGTAAVRWNSFNVGEWWLPESRFSLLPVVLLGGGLVAAAWREIRRH